MKINISISFFIIIAFLSKAQEIHHAAKKQITEKMVFAKIEAIPEVWSYLKKNKKYNAALMIVKSPEPGFRYYWIKLGISSSDMFRTSDDFYFDPETSNIRFVDMLDSSGMMPLTLREWRKFRSNPRFWKQHIIKAGRIIPID